MNKQRDRVLGVFQLGFIAAVAILASCVVSTASDKPAFGIIEFLYRGQPMDVRVAPYDSVAACEANIHAHAKTAHEYPDVEVRYLCIKQDVFKHIDALGGPAPVEPTQSDQITRL